MIGLQSGIEVAEVDGPAVRQLVFPEPTVGRTQFAGVESVVKAALLRGVTRAKAGEAVARRAPPARITTPAALTRRRRAPTRSPFDFFHRFILFLAASCSIGFL
jgi:hypothetical protein